MLETRGVPAPGLRTEQALQLDAVLLGQEEEIDLVGELVLDNSPGEASGVEQPRVEPDSARRRVRIDVALDVDRHLAPHEAPVERARREGFLHLTALSGGAALEVVAPAARERVGSARHDRKDKEEQNKNSRPQKHPSDLRGGRPLSQLP